MPHCIWDRDNVLIASRCKRLFGEIANLDFHFGKELAGLRVHHRQCLVVPRYVFVAEHLTSLVSCCYHKQRSLLVEVLGDFVVQLVVGAHDVEAYSWGLMFAMRLV